jgi:hypothetical protein
VTELKTDFRAGKITEAEYDRRVRSAKFTYAGKN